MHVDDSLKVTWTNSYKTFDFMRFEIIIYFPVRFRETRTIEISAHEISAQCHVLPVHFREHLEQHTCTKTVLISFCIKCTAFNTQNFDLC